MILHVIKSNIYSGAENVVCKIINGLSDKEEFIYMAPHGPIEDKLKSIGLYDCYYGIDKLDVATIKAAVDKFHPTALHAHDFTASVLCGLAVKGKIPVISHLHCNPLWLKNPLHPNTISYLFASRWFSQIITVSEAVEKEYCYSSKLKCPVNVLGNPFSAQTVLDAAGDSDDEFVSDLLYVGRFNPAKNPLGAIKIFEALPNRDNLIFRMVGNGELLDECKEYAASHGLSISFEGFQDNVYKYMKNTKVLLMPSIFEGFGLVALESMTLGIPVVCSGVGGLPGIVNDTCGYICNETSEYVDAISSLLSDSSLYSSKSESAIIKSSTFDNLSSYLENILSLYKKLR
ncbi:glycosyltransferase [Pseudobutyrivibrio xylanivorans]|uniref:Glycosyltransferase involved in cell wall bisynthesis n=1 Tax=Pseudobutyrivibrio xylanivorans DSM 14809 TaxID=1123012 RepID=A0A1M6GYH2_PSEXY|nr:glycosyltransferase [Pseudobutyrivibrio xylanivorans]SHJ15009.1 Glycosyltransferase involved in cell wall bisynthesis [Pseudobutyrivibrio xylanivorans DSM 14809]